MSTTSMAMIHNPKDSDFCSFDEEQDQDETQVSDEVSTVISPPIRRPPHITSAKMVQPKFYHATEEPQLETDQEDTDTDTDTETDTDTDTDAGDHHGDHHGENSTSTSASTVSSSLGEHWVLATCLVRDNPALMTNRVFLTALENQPPVDVIQFMLAVNPKVANIPPEGPTALQVAVQHEAPLGVVEILLEACPFALCVTNPQHALDPLSYARRHRAAESGLLELLSRPLGYWVTERHDGSNNAAQSSAQKNSSLVPQEPQEYYRLDRKQKKPTEVVERPLLLPSSNSNSNSSNKKAPGSSTSQGRTGTYLEENERASSLPTRMSPSSSFAAPPKYRSATTTSATATAITTHSTTDAADRIDRQELNNVKLLCAQVLKGHKKLSKQLKVCQEQVQAQKEEEGSAPTPDLDRDEILKDVKAAQAHQFRRQLIALDMKERAFQAHVKVATKDCRKQFDERWTRWSREMESWRFTTDQKLNEWQVLLAHEIQVNAHFRSDFGQWMEERDISSVDDNNTDTDTGNGVSFLFATNMGEVSERAPFLRVTGSSSTEEEEEPLDEIRMLGPPRTKRRSWNPLARNKWDQIVL